MELRRGSLRGASPLFRLVAVAYSLHSFTVKVAQSSLARKAPVASVRRRASRRSLIAILAVCALGLLLVVAVSALGSQRRVCVGCHESAAEGLAKTSHSAVSCYDCHLEAGLWSYPTFKANEVFRMYPQALIGAESTRTAVRTSAAACAQCHQSTMKATTPQSVRGLRILHSACAVSQGSCDPCHPTTGHGTESRAALTTTMSDCIRCHRERSVSEECGTCHQDGRDSSELRVKPVTHTRTWNTLHGMGELDQCSLCHAQKFCTECHEVVVPHPAEFGREHGEAALESRKVCSTCHRQVFCDSCHGVPMPHPAAYLQKHSKATTTTADPKCIRCHSGQDCDRCHARHIHGGSARGVPVPRPAPPARYESSDGS